MRELFQKYRRVLSFGVVGCINTAVDFLVFALLSEMAMTRPELAHSAGYCAGILCSFVLNNVFTFSDAKKESAVGQAMRFARFMLVNGLSWLLSTSVIHYLTVWGMFKYLAKFFASAMAMVVNYFGYKVLVFKIKGG